MTTPTESRTASATLPEPTDTHGFVVLGAVLLCVIGTINLIQGVTALRSEELIGQRLVYDDLTAWGWVFLTWGALQLASGAFAFGRNRWALSLGMTLATISAVFWFFMVLAAPAAAFVAIAINVAIIASFAGAYQDAE